MSVDGLTDISIDLHLLLKVLRQLNLLSSLIGMLVLVFLINSFIGYVVLKFDWSS